MDTPGVNQAHHSSHCALCGENIGHADEFCDNCGTLVMRATATAAPGSSSQSGQGSHQKGFAGSFKVVAVLGVLTLSALFMLGKAPLGVALPNLVLWGGILALYCWLKYE